ncbi:MAG TPA: glycosyltransferase family 4 protein [Chloroflexia bacterium]|nr:glycosyltransferase family 4 protein [Chloroflexia bacterium]
MLGGKHEITLLSFSTAHVSRAAVEQIAPYCAHVLTVPLRRMRMPRNLASGVFSRYPFQTLLYQMPAMIQAVRNQVHTGRFDLAHVQLARMAPYLESTPALPRVIDLIDALSLNMARRHHREHGPLRLATYIEHKRLLRYEQTICRTFDEVTVVSPIDQAAIGSFPNLHVNPIGVDIVQFPFLLQDREPQTLVFSGNMGYFPNANAVCWFAREVLPLIKRELPNIVFQIVGANPPRLVQKLAAADRAITITGYVESIQAYLARATVAVVPLRAGSGMQFKVLEAMACGTPLVITPYALGGIDAIHGEHLLIGENPAAFARQVVRLVADGELRQRLAGAARKLIEEKYTWEQSVAGLERIHALAAQRTVKNAQAKTRG